MPKNSTSSVLITGGLGYLGSHTLIALLEKGKRAIVLDNLSNSSLDVVRRVYQITGVMPDFIEGDIRDRSKLNKIFLANNIEAVLHFAGLKAVGESVAEPLAYYDNNVSGTTTLLTVMEENGCKKLVFSSSATVYGEPETLPIRENFPRSAKNPYGASKLIIEDILRDLTSADLKWKVAVLRYFNPVGAHPSGLIGESPAGKPNNLLPYISEVASGKRDVLTVFGSDYPTKDGTGVRDYIHVVDLAEGHLRALDALNEKIGNFTINLGTGRAYSVLEVIRAFEQAAGRSIPYVLADRRPGDVASCYADPSLAEDLLSWRAKRDLSQMCEDAWRWQMYSSRSSCD